MEAEGWFSVWLTQPALWKGEEQVQKKLSEEGTQKATLLKDCSVEM